MTYSNGSLIQASDYNNYAGGGAANVSGQLNTVLGTGKGNAGYGQTTVSNVTAVANLVTATQWTSLINGINTVTKHQNSGFSNLGTVLAGDRITANLAISTALSNAYTNRISFATQGSTLTGSTFNSAFTAPNDTNAATFQLSRTATFANADATRYFFNAGGTLNFVFTAITNTGATDRGADMGNLCVTNFGSKKFFAGNTGAITGTGGTTTDTTTNNGYYGQTTSNTTLTTITSTSTSYTTDVFTVYAKTNGVQGSNSDNGTVVTLSAQWVMGAQAGFNDSIDVTIPHRIDVIYPETTFLANTWGSVTVA